MITRLTHRLLPWLIAACAAAVYCSFSVHQWNGFISPSWDLGIFTQLADQYAHLNAPIVDIKGPGYNLLGDHFHPLLVVLGPIFRLFPSGLTLLVLQNLLFAWSSVPITRLATERLGRVWGALLGISYVLSWGLIEAVAAQFHEIALAVPLLAFGLVHWMEGKKRGYVEIALLAFVKEDLGLTVAAFGLVVIWQAWGQLPHRTWGTLKEALRGKDARRGAFMVIWGLVWCALAITVILPLLNPGGVWDYTGRLADTGDDGGAHGLVGSLLSFFTPAQKYLTLALLVTAAGGIGLLSPIMLLMLPTLLWRFAGNVPFYWGFEWHYSAILIPIAAVALIDGAGRIHLPRRRTLTGVAVCLCLATNAYMALTGPIGDAAAGRSYTMDEEAGRGAIEAAGTGHAVVSDFRMLAYLVPNNTVYWEGTVANARVDVAVLSPGHAAHHEVGGPARWAEQKLGGIWDITYDTSGFTVLKRQTPMTDSP